jgi:hypothetical protein
MAPNSSDMGSNVPLGDNAASTDIVDAARGRSDGFDMGGDRAITNPPNWNSPDSNALYLGATKDNDPGTAEAIGQTWSKHGSELNQAATDLYNAISDLGSVWVGQGAAAAQGALVGIANSSSQASEAAHAMASRLAQQAAAAAEVKKMPAPKNYDPAQAMGAALAGGPAALIADQKAQSDAAADVKAQQVAFMNAYTNSLSEVDSSTPSFGPESLGMKPTAGHNSSGSFGRVGGVGGTGGVSSVGDPSIVGASYNTGSSGGVGAAPVHNPAAAPAAPGHFGAAAYGAPVAGGASSGAGAVTPAMPAASGGGVGVGAALGLGVVGGGLGLAGARALGKGSKSGSKANDDTTQASANENAQNAASANGPQAHGVVSANGTIGGGAPQPPMGGMGGMGGGAHQAEEDETHMHASYLIEADPDDVFGANEATPPPVIGAWTEDDGS